MARSSGATSATGPCADVGQPDTGPSTPALPLTFRGSRVARALLRLGGWRVHFDGLPALQGVLAVYPHTSNWDFVVGMLAKWSIGVPLMFWGKDSLFRIPVFGAWLRLLGGVPVERTSAKGAVGAMAARLVAEREAGRYFWLGLAPEGTRKLLPGWRSGFYRLTLSAGLPLGLVALDYGRREVRVTDFITLSGDEAADMARIAAIYDGVRGCRSAQAAPVRLLDPAVPRSDTIVR